MKEDKLDIINKKITVVLFSLVSYLLLIIGTFHLAIITRIKFFEPSNYFNINPTNFKAFCVLTFALLVFSYISHEIARRATITINNLKKSEQGG